MTGHICKRHGAALQASMLRDWPLGLLRRLLKAGYEVHDALRG